MRQQHLVSSCEKLDTGCVMQAQLDRLYNGSFHMLFARMLEAEEMTEDEWNEGSGGAPIRKDIFMIRTAEWSHLHRGGGMQRRTMTLPARPSLFSVVDFW